MSTVDISALRAASRDYNPVYVYDFTWVDGTESGIFEDRAGKRYNGSDADEVPVGATLVEAQVWSGTGEDAEFVDYVLVEKIPLGSRLALRGGKTITHLTLESTMVALFAAEGGR